MMYYNLSGELHINASKKAVIKTLFTKIAKMTDIVLDDERDHIHISRKNENVVISFDLRFDSQNERNEIRDWLVERHENAIKGVLREHTCNDENEENCTDYAEVLKLGDWVDD